MGWNLLVPISYKGNAALDWILGQQPRNVLPEAFLTMNVTISGKPDHETSGFTYPSVGTGILISLRRLWVMNFMDW